MPGVALDAYGVAIDVGSTTIAVYLCDLASGATLASVGAMNPQIRFGEDLMSRVSYAMMNPGGVEALTSAVREAIDALIGEAAARGRRSRAETSSRSRWSAIRSCIISRSGSTRPRSAARPFALAIDCACEVKARDLGLAVAPGAYVYALPCIAGHVGADAAAVVLAEAPYLGRRTAADRRRRHQCGDRVRRPPSAARRLLADRAGVRGRADLLRPARRPGRDRARAHRPARRSSRASR